MGRVRFGRALLLGLDVPLSLFGCGARTDLLDTLPISVAAPVSEAGADAAIENCPQPSQVNSGLACTVSGLACLSGTIANDCNSQQTIAVTCSCGQGMWNCPHIVPTCPPPPMCPAPATIRSGGSCTVLSGVICAAATPIRGCGGAVLGYVLCACAQGQWACKDPGPPSCVDASSPPVTCPDPRMLVEGAACSAAGRQCGGNPTLCNGATFYDALRCDGTKFVTIAMTVCGIDAGTASDARTADAASE